MLAMIVGIAVIMFLLVVNFGKNGHLEDDHTDDDRSLM
jgi:hypothetical protein